LLQTIVLAIVYSTFLWWFSTGVIFYLNARPTHTFRWSLLGATIIVIGALYGLWITARADSLGAVLIAFTCGLLIWGWHTMTYYMGWITGPRRHRCPEGCRGWKHFRHAVETSLYHELAIIATAVLMAVLTWREPNQFGLWTFLILWGMHVSAKLNVFFGVRNLNEEFIPEHLSYLKGFFRRRSMNLLFPFSVTIGTFIAVLLAQNALDPEGSVFTSAGYTLLATLMALAVIEHWFLILPIPAEALWRWSLDPAPVVHEQGNPDDHRAKPASSQEPSEARASDRIRERDRSDSKRSIGAGASSPGSLNV